MLGTFYMTERPTLHKIAILGTPRSGKTTLMVRLAKGLVDPAIQSTRGIDFHLVNVSTPNNLKLQIWDLAGQDLYRNSGIFDDMVWGSSAFLFCYNASDASSIEKIDKWIGVARNHKKFNKTLKYLIGLKADLVDTGQQIALNKLVEKYMSDPELNIKHIICSAHGDMNINELLEELSEDLSNLEI